MLGGGGRGGGNNSVFFLQQYYENASYVPKEVFTPLPLAEPGLVERWLSRLRGGNRVYLRTPQRGGQKKQLIDLVMKNAQVVLTEIRSREAYQEKAAQRAAEELQNWSACLHRPQE